MKEKFTPGPWFIEVGEGEYDGDIYVCHQGTECDETTIVNFEEPTDEDAANANLIAAAPDMYEALRAVDVWENPSCFEKVKAALKKARGES